MQLILVIVSSVFFSWFFSMQFSKYAMKVWGEQQDEFFKKIEDVVFEAIDKWR